MAPLGCVVQIHVNPNRRAYWEPHCISWWYLGTYTKKYRCYNVWSRETDATIVSDKLYLEKNITNLIVTPEDAVVHSAQQLTAALKGNLMTAMDEIGIDQLNKLDAIFNTTVNNLRQQKEKIHRRGRKT